MPSRFVIVDPSDHQTADDKKRRALQIRSYAATISHKRRRLLPDPCMVIAPPPKPKSERRSLQYFSERTSLDCAGWNDNSFWTIIAPRLAASYPSVSKALSALGACHEALATGDEGLAEFSIGVGRQALIQLNQDHAKAQLSVLLAQCIITTALAALLNDTIWEQAQRLQNAFADLDSDDEYGLVNLIKQNRSRWCQFLDPLHLLRTGIIPAPLEYSFDFTDLAGARYALQQVLNQVGRQAQLQRDVDMSPLDQWNKAFKTLKTDNYTSWLGLRAAYGMAIVQIETMHADSEMVYDKYLRIYKDVVDVFELSFQRQNNHDRPTIRFGLDSGVFLLMRWAFKWCRLPSLRRRMIDLLGNTLVAEEVQGCKIDALRSAIIQRIEEEGLPKPPTTTAEIPETNRIRWVGLSHWTKRNVQRIDYLRFPYAGDKESFWISIPKIGTQIGELDIEDYDQIEPDFVFAPGFRKSLQADGSYWSLKAAEFYFAIPRL